MNDENGANRDEVYSKRVKAGKRTYFFDVKRTNGNDFYLVITESKRRFEGDGYVKHKIFLYKEDFNKFASGLEEVVNHVKNELMPDYDFTQFDKDFQTENHSEGTSGWSSDYSYDDNLNEESPSA